MISIVTLYSSKKHLENYEKSPKFFYVILNFFIYFSINTIFPLIYRKYEAFFFSLLQFVTFVIFHNFPFIFWISICPTHFQHFLSKWLCYKSHIETIRNEIPCKGILLSYFLICMHNWIENFKSPFFAGIKLTVRAFWDFAKF